MRLRSSIILAAIISIAWVAFFQQSSSHAAVGYAYINYRTIVGPCYREDSKKCYFVASKEDQTMIGVDYINSSSSDELCGNDIIQPTTQYGTAKRKYQKKPSQGACSTVSETVVDIRLNTSRKNVHLYSNSKNEVRPVNGNGGVFYRATKTMGDMPAAWLSDPSTTNGCPYGIVKYNSGGIGLIAGIVTNDPPSDKFSSEKYRELFKRNYPGSDLSNCYFWSRDGVRSKELFVARNFGFIKGSAAATQISYFVNIWGQDDSVLQLPNEVIGNEEDVMIPASDCPTELVDGKCVPKSKKTQGDSADGDGKATCAVEGVGWIVCPVVTFMTKLNDMAFKFISSVLTVNPDLFQQEPAKAAWTSFRNIANVMFVIAFMIIIYSQLTSVGLTNYGIKKLLPKLVLAVVLVNFSYVICQTLVDISNVVGVSMYKVFTNIPIGPEGKVATEGGAMWQTIGAWILGATGLVALIALIILAPTVLLVVALVALILIARQGFVVILVILSPLAFAALLLPNTESFFKKWWKIFTAMLILFPMVGALFGGGMLASNILMGVSECNTSCEGDDQQMLAIVAMSVTALPLVALPFLLKTSLSSLGQAGGMLGRIVDKAQSRAGNRVKAKSSEAYQNSTLGRLQKYRANEKKKRSALISAGAYRGRFGKMNPRNLRSGINDRFNTSAVSGRFGDRTAAEGAKMAIGIESEEVDNAAALMSKQWSPNEMLGNSTAAYQKALESGDATKARAAQKLLLQQGSKGTDAIRSVVAGLSNEQINNNQAVEAVRSDLSSAGLKTKDAALDRWSYDANNRTFAEVSQDASVFSNLSGSELSTQTASSIKNAIDSNALSPERASELLADETLRKSLGGVQRAELQRHATGQLITSRDQAHEEALVQNNLYDMNNRQR